MTNRRQNKAGPSLKTPQSSEYRRPRTRGSSKTITDTYQVDYNAVSIDQSIGAEPDVIVTGARLYAPGYKSGLASVPAGVALAALYNIGKFLPGTYAKWAPAVGATKSGRILMAYLTNPEDILTFEAATDPQKLVIIQACANMVQHPIWQEFQYNIPSTLRRKMFDVNVTMANAVDTYERCVQGALIWYVSSDSNTFAGNVLFHDKVMLTGLCNIAT